jgi:hypothetical protein
MNTTNSNLAEDLSKIIDRGCSCQPAVIERAVAIRAAVALEDFAYAEELAIEIEQLQAAHMERDVPQNPDYISPQANYIVWKLTAERWAEYVISASRCDRIVRTEPGTGRAEAMQEFQRLFNARLASQNIAKDDFFRAPKTKKVKAQ